MRLKFGRLLTTILSLSASQLLGESPSAAPVAAEQEEARAAFLKIIDRPRVDLAPSETKLEPKDGFTRIHFTYASDADQRVPGLLLAKDELLTDGKRHPIAIFLHGTTGNKEALQSIMEKVAARGILTAAIDGRFHGERGTFAQYNAEIAKAFETGQTHPLYLDTCWDVMRLIDYLQTRPDVDAKHIGLMGFSKGGVETWMTAAVDERISVVIPAISAQSYEWQLEHNVWKDRASSIQAGFDAAAKSAGVTNPGADFVRTMYQKLVPGLFDRFDGPQMISQIAPRPLLLINGESDPIMPIASVQVVVDKVKPLYDAAGESDRFKFLIEPHTKHAVTAEGTAAAVDWFDKWLNHG